MSATAVRGTLAATTVTPADLDEAQRTLAEAARAKHTVAFVGGGTELGFGYAPTRVDVLVETTKLDRIVEYQPADMVVEVECGVTLAALGKHLAPHGQRLALDAPQPHRATLGGLVATNAFGPLRTRFGSMRDLIVGVSFVRADGARVRGGGKVVKNVAGFDLPKLAVGSLGSLAMIATVTLRLHPLPEATLGFATSHASAQQVADIVRGVFASQLEPAALVAVREADGYVVLAAFEGFASGAREQVERFATLVRGLGLDGVERAGIAEEIAVLDGHARAHGDVRTRVAVPPAEFARTDAEIVAPLVAAFDSAHSATITYPTLGVAFVSGPATAKAGDGILAARHAAEARGGNLVVTHCDDASLATTVDVYGTLPPSFALMRGLKERFDPERRLNPGRFLGKL